MVSEQYGFAILWEVIRGSLIFEICAVAFFNSPWWLWLRILALLVLSTQGLQRIKISQFVFQDGSVRVIGVR